MANSKLITVALLLATASLATVLFYSTGPGDDGGRGGVPWGASSITTLPFSPMDILPLLPRHVAMAAVRALRGVSDIFPVFVGAASAASGAAGSAGLEWKGACFYENEAWLVFHNDSGSKYGGGTLHIKEESEHDFEISHAQNCSFKLEIEHLLKRSMTFQLLIFF